jgi:hypothetical protein
MAAAGPVVETVSRKRVLSAAEVAADSPVRKTPEFWEFIETMTPEMWGGDYLLYILREDPKPSMYGGTNTLEKCPGYIAMPDGTKQPLSSREDIELAIKIKYGGKAFRLILKKGSERICEGKCINEAPPKYPDQIPQYPNHALPNAQQSDTNAIAAKAIDTVANQPAEVMNIAINALRASAEMIARSSTPPAAAQLPPAENDLDKALRQAMIARLLAPPPDPLDQLKQFAALRELFTPPQNGVVDKLVTTALDRFMNPVSSGGRTTLLDLGREALPVLAGTVDKAMTNWRLGVEAQRDAIALQRGVNPPPAVAAPAQIASVTEMPAPAAAAEAAPQPGGGPPSGEPPFDWLAMKIVEICKEQEFTVEEAVDETLSFLYRSHAPVVAMLLDPPKLDPRLAPGEQGILMLFQNHPILKQVPVNPRLTEFIKKFVAAAKEAESKRTPGPAPVPSA